MRSTGMNQKRKHRRLSLLLAAVLILGTSAVQGPDSLNSRESTLGCHYKKCCKAA